MTLFCHCISSTGYLWHCFVTALAVLIWLFHQKYTLWNSDTLFCTFNADADQNRNKKPEKATTVVGSCPWKFRPHTAATAVAWFTLSVLWRTILSKHFGEEEEKKPHAYSNKTTCGIFQFFLFGLWFLGRILRPKFNQPACGPSEFLKLHCFSGFKLDSREVGIAWRKLSHSKAVVKHDRAWSPHGWVTVSC